MYLRTVVWLWLVNMIIIK